MFRHLSNLVAVVAYSLFGLSGGLAWASCGEPECTSIVVEGNVEWGICIQYDSSYASICHSVSPDGGDKQCGSGNQMRTRESCDNETCDWAEVQPPYTESFLGASGEAGTWIPIENCSCIPNS